MRMNLNTRRGSVHGVHHMNLAGLASLGRPGLPSAFNVRRVALGLLPTGLNRGLGDDTTSDNYNYLVAEDIAAGETPAQAAASAASVPVSILNAGSAGYNATASLQTAAYEQTPEYAFTQGQQAYQNANPGSLVIPADLSTGPPTMAQVTAAMNAQAMYVGGPGATATQGQINTAYQQATAAYQAGMTAANAVAQAVAAGNSVYTINGQTVLVPGNVSASVPAFTPAPTPAATPAPTPVTTPVSAPATSSVSPGAPAAATIPSMTSASTANQSLVTPAGQGSQAPIVIDLTTGAAAPASSTNPAAPGTCSGIFGASGAYPVPSLAGCIGPLDTGTWLVIGGAVLLLVLMSGKR